MCIHLNRLKIILKENNKRCLFPCIKDMVNNGFTLKRFSTEDHKPSRQDITQYIAAWFKYIGVSSDECWDWMSEYCLDILSTLSSSSNSQIRHSTKSNIKYIYNSDVPFDCGCENNHFKASCDQNCPAYKEMYDRDKKKREVRDINQSYETEGKDNEVELQKFSIKDKYRDQFEKAMEIANNHIKTGVSKQKILTLLNESEFKTRTGKKWSYSILGNELRRHTKNIDKVEEYPQKMRNEKD